MSELEDNNQLVLVSGKSTTGKSATLRNIRNQPRWMYLNTEANKKLPFKNDFRNFNISDPYQVFEAFDHAIANEDNWDGIAIDTATFLMEMYESQYVLRSANTMQAWGQYAQFWKELMQEKVKLFKKPVLILAHTLSQLNEGSMEMETAVPVKGSLKNNGIEAYFSTVISTKRVSVKTLENFKNPMLTINEDEEDLGFKHVFQTRLTKETIGERIRSPMGMFSKTETYIDNDVQLVLDHLKAYYG